MLNKKHLITIIGLLLLILILPLALFLTRQRQEIRKKAEGTREVELILSPILSGLKRGEGINGKIILSNVSQRNILASGAQATIEVSDKFTIVSVKCEEPFNGLSIARINGQIVTFLCAIGVGVNPPALDNLGKVFASLNVSVKDDAPYGPAFIKFTSTRVTEAGITGQAPDVSTRGQDANFTILETTPVISPTPTIIPTITSIPITTSTPTPSVTMTLPPTLSPTPTLTPVPLASPTPAITPITRDCSTKVFGDADCDGQTTLDDFKYWLCEFIGGGVCQDINSGRWSDFFRDSKVDLVDFEVYRRNVYK